MVPALRVRSRLLAGLLSLLLLLAAVVAPAASAQVETVPASGQFSVTSEEITVVLDAPGATIMHIEETVEFTGTMTGEARATARCIVDAEGQGECVVFGTFEGSIAGRSGTAAVHVHFDANMVEDSVSGNAVVIGTSGELAGSTGQLMVEATGDEGTYTGEVILSR